MKFNHFNILNENIPTNISLNSRHRRYLLESFCKRLEHQEFRLGHQLLAKAIICCSQPSKSPPLAGNKGQFTFEQSHEDQFGEDGKWMG